MNKHLKASKESETGLNTQFKNINTGSSISLKQAIEQIEKGNPTYEDYHIAHKGETKYIRSNPDSKTRNNIE
ncbi:MAG: DUF3892 domain-containing protein [Oscillospiraceae bacterium]